MKRITSILLTIILTLSMTATALAAHPKYVSSQEEYTYFDDGSYSITVIETEDDFTISLFATTSTKTGSKTFTYYNSNNEALWYVKVMATFSYGSGSSKCTNASVSAASNSSNWKISDKSVSKSANTATAKATAKRYAMGFTVKTIQESVTLTCSSTGKLS